MKGLSSYPKLWAFGSTPVRDVLLDDVVVEEKVDGSQLSFGVIDGELRMRSKNCDIVLDAPNSMFSKAVDEIRLIAADLHPGWTYRGEYLQKPKHNHLEYARTPRRSVVLFDVTMGDMWCEKAVTEAEAERLGLDHTPVLFSGRLEHIGQIEPLMKRRSILGGDAFIEGLAIKNYWRWGIDGKPLFAKLVREDFKEEQNADWKTKQKSMADIRDELGQQLQSPARWRKAIQRMQEEGTYTGTPKDIGSLIKLVQADLDEEAKTSVQQALIGWAWPHVARVAIRGLPEWYKQHLTQGTV